MEGADDTTTDGAGKERRPRVLIVDGEAAILSLLARALPPYGLEVVTAAGSADATEALRRRPGEFALALLSLKGLEGPTTLAVLREKEPGLRAVFMTGGLVDLMEKGIAESGVLAVVPKPFKLDELAALLLRLACRTDAGRSAWMPTYPTVDESIDRLSRARWSVGDAAIGPPHALMWFVTGHSGENSVKAEGRTRAEAYWRACVQAGEAGILAPPVEPEGLEQLA